MKNANPVSCGIRAALASFIALCAAGCGSDRSEKAEAAAPKTVYDHFAIDVGGHPASLQFAVLGPEQERGLMQRMDLGRDEGMIFVNAAPRTLSIWMHNTPEALDLAYLSPDGTLVEVYDLLPLDERPVNSHSGDVQFALEMPKGWFSANGIRPGARIDMKAVTDAMVARGFDPVKYRLRERWPSATP